VGGRGAWLLLLAGSLAGCGSAPPAPERTGAEEAVRAFFEALVRREWPRAFAAVHPESRARWDAGQFARRAADFRAGLGFEPARVGISACEEQGGEAIAHVLITGRAGGRLRHYKDAVVLRRAEGGWGVVLPPGFGRTRPR
jgi:hypothetical protein